MISELFIGFLEESMEFMSDKDIYLLYRDYNKKKHQTFINGNIEDYKQLSHVVNTLKKEVLSRCYL